MTDLNTEDNYTSGQVSKLKYLAYYKAVLKYLCKINQVECEEEDLTIPEYRQLINELLEF